MEKIISTTDKYEISEFMLELAKKHNPELSKETLMLSQFGYMIEMYSKIMQSSILSANRWSRESFPILSSIERSIMTNAVTYNIENINAIPAKMEILFSILEEDLVQLFPSKGERSNRTVKEDIVISKDCKFNIEGFEFHLDYDIILTRTQKKDNSVIYTARYDFSEINPKSDIINPYLNPPHFYFKNNDKFLGIYTRISQISSENHDIDIITDNIILNRIVDFEFEGDMSWFTVKVENKITGEIKELKPVVEGMPYEGIEDYCFYSYIKRNHIRIKFVPDSYYPQAGAKVYLSVYTTRGADGNFRYQDGAYIINNLISEKYSYNDIQVTLTPLTESFGGCYSKSLEDIKTMIPKEILSRKVITCEADLYNFFNTLDDNIVKFYKRRHNQIDHLYYAYLISKDYDGNIIPTNTLNIQVTENDLEKLDSQDGRYVIPTGTMFKIVDKENAIIIHDKDDIHDNIYEEEDKSFIYTNPINLIINKDPISSSYYLDIMNMNIPLYMDYINSDSILHVMLEYINIVKIFLDGTDYKFNLKFKQTISDDMGIIIIDKDTNEITESNIKVALVIKQNNFSYYIFGELISFNQETFEYEFEFILKASKYINKENKFRINDIFIGGTTSQSYVDLPKEIQIEFLFFMKFEKEYGRYESDKIIPDMEGWTLCNKYSPKNKFELYYNYSNIMTSFTKYDDMSDLNKGFKIFKVPMVRYSYFYDRHKCFRFVDNIHYKKLSIDNMLDIIIKPFGLDLKLFNTYGPSNVFHVGHTDELLDRVNVTFEFNLRLKAESSETIITDIIKFIKNSIENLNYLNESIHITNITTEITNKFKDDIEFIEFIKFNNYSALIQYFERQELNYISDVPEFINIDLDNKLNPKIKINII